MQLRYWVRRGNALALIIRRTYTHSWRKKIMCLVLIHEILSYLLKFMRSCLDYLPLMMRVLLIRNKRQNFKYNLKASSVCISGVTVVLKFNLNPHCFHRRCKTHLPDARNNIVISKIAIIIGSYPVQFSYYTLMFITKRFLHQRRKNIYTYTWYIDFHYIIKTLYLYHYK